MRALALQTITICAILIATLIALQAQAEEDTSKTSTPLPKAEKTKFLANYNLMHRTFEGTVKSNYAYAPDHLVVTTHNFGLGYYVLPNYILGVSSKYIRNDINLKSSLNIPGMPQEINASTEGLSDTLVGVTREWNFKNNSFLFIAANLSLPTGSYKEKTDSGKLVSYQGQLGSGTYDLAPYMAYRRKMDSWDFMTRLQARVHMGRNDLDYRLGDEIMGIASAGYWLNKYVAVTGGLYYRNWREVVGSENVTAFNSKVSQSQSRHSMTSSHGGSARTHQGPPPQHGNSPSSSNPHTGSARPSASSFASINTTDIFATSGARFSAQVGLKSGIYLGPIFRGVIEAGVPVYNEQVGPLQGLNTDWYLVTSLQSNF